MTGVVPGEVAGFGWVATVPVPHPTDPAHAAMANAVRTKTVARIAFTAHPQSISGTVFNKDNTSDPSVAVALEPSRPMHGHGYDNITSA